MPQLDGRNVLSTIFSPYHCKDREFLYALNHDCDHLHFQFGNPHLTSVLREKDSDRRNKLFNEAKLQSQITKYI